MQTPMRIATTAMMLAGSIATKDNAIRLETGQQLEFRLKQPVTLHTVAA